MKRFFLVFLFLSIILSVKAQPTVLALGERLPNLYYWDTNWYDSVVLKYPGPGSYSLFSMNPLMTGGVSSYGRPCYTPTPMKVIGLAAPVGYIKDSLLLESAAAPIFDTVFANRVPEYLFMYQMGLDSFELLYKGRWDTATPQYKMTIPFSGCTMYKEDSLWPLYQVFFENPIMAQDTFVVGGTLNNFQYHGYDSSNISYGLEHIPSIYPVLFKNNYPLHPQDPSFFVAKKDWPFNYVHPYSSTAEPADTSIIYTYDMAGGELWLPFFAIFDTNFVSRVGTYNDSCEMPTELMLESVYKNTVTVAWDDGGMTDWELLIYHPEENPNTGTLQETPINYAQITGLDTAQWYAVQVRSLCDKDVFGPWSDTIMFYVPWYTDTCNVPTGLHMTTLDSTIVTLSWNVAEAIAWEVEIGTDGTDTSDGQLMAVTTNAVVVEGLDTAAWYWARVRVQCDTDFWSDWTDTIRFFVPNPNQGGPDTNSSDTTTAINMVEQYTYLMPNPAREEVTVMSSFKVRSVELYAADGNLLKKQEVNGLGMRLSLEGLPAGVYFVRVRTTAGVTTKRLVIEK